MRQKYISIYQSVLTHVSQDRVWHHYFQLLGENEKDDINHDVCLHLYLCAKVNVTAHR